MSFSKKMLLLAFAAFAAVVGACAAFSQSPESLLETGYRSHNVGSTTNTALLKSNKVSIPQAQKTNAVLHTTIDLLDEHKKTLADCRKRSNSTQITIPDPCRGSIESDIQMVLQILSTISTNLENKEKQ